MWISENKSQQPVSHFYSCQSTHLITTAMWTWSNFCGKKGSFTDCARPGRKWVNSFLSLKVGHPYFVSLFCFLLSLCALCGSQSFSERTASGFRVLAILWICSWGLNTHHSPGKLLSRNRTEQPCKITIHLNCDSDSYWFTWHDNESVLKALGSNRGETFESAIRKCI